MTVSGSANGSHDNSAASRYDDTLARLRGPHEVGKPCPRKPWMLVTTLDIERGRCGACGNVLGGLHRG